VLPPKAETRQLSIYGKAEKKQLSCRHEKHQGATGKQACPAAFAEAQSRSASARLASGPTRSRVSAPAGS
jgi:hypothetical protein